MNKNFVGVIGAVLAVILIIWLISGGSISCHESFWDSDKKIIEIKHD